MTGRANWTTAKHHMGVSATGSLAQHAQVKPSLLHGDLWSGNMSSVDGGGWSILDPAVYYVRLFVPFLHCCIVAIVIDLIYKVS